MAPDIDLTELPDELRCDQHQWVFVVTYGRSGSTLVQGLLNALPRTLVRGENGFYILHQWRAANAAVSFGQRHLKHRPYRASSAFFGVHLLAAARFVASTRSLTREVLLGLRKPHDVDRLGFKEVLWHEIAPDETERFFSWFEQVFPGATYVLNTRDPERAANSGFWLRFDREVALQRINRVREVQEFLRTTRPDRVVDIRFESIISKEPGVADAELTRLATFVTGACEPELLAELHAVLSDRHGPPTVLPGREGATPDERGSSTD